MIILVRHGEAAHHIGDLTGGWTDSALTDAGRVQIGEAAKDLANLCRNKQPVIFSSDLTRARQSAELIAEPWASPVEYRSFLREKNNGQAAGKTNVEAKILRLPRQADEPDNRNYPGGETRREFFERVIEGMIALPLEEERLILVTHKGTIQNILFWWLKLSIDRVCRSAVSFAARAGSITVLQINKWGEREISLLNYRRYNLSSLLKQ